MAKFAVYYIPPAKSDLYRHGSEILGYDVRAGVFLPENNPTRAALPEFDPAWVENPQTYGFHMTTGYSLFYDPVNLPAIEAELESIMSCFGEGLQFMLTPYADERIWRDEIIALRYQPNPAMLMLHTMITARVNPFGTGSTISRRYTAQNTVDPASTERIRKYYTPYMLDGWIPHFTLMMPYAGSQPQAMRAALDDLFPDVPIWVESICLLVMDDNETHYRFHREFFCR